VRVSDARREERERVEDERNESQRDHGADRSTASTQLVTLQRVKHYNPSLHRETDHRPRRQETAHVRTVHDRLTPAVLVEYVDPDPCGSRSSRTRRRR